MIKYLRFRYILRNVLIAVHMIRYYNIGALSMKLAVSEPNSDQNLINGIAQKKIIIQNITCLFLIWI